MNQPLPDEIEVEQVFRDDGRIAEIVWFPPGFAQPTEDIVAREYDYIPTIDAPVETTSDGTRFRRTGRYVRREMS